MKRIAILLPGYLGGGAETVTDAIVSQLKHRGFEFILITSKLIEECRPKVESLYDRVIVTEVQMDHVNQKTTRLLVDVVRPLKADIIWMLCCPYPNPGLLRSALNSGGKVVFHLHSIPYYEAMFKDHYVKMPDHGPNDYYRWYIYKHLKQKFLKIYTWRFRRLQAPFLHEIDRYVVLCKGYARTLRLMNPLRRHKFVTMYNPAPKSDCAVAPKRKELIFVGRLSHMDKRVDNLLKIFSLITDKHPDWTLKIVGDGPDRANLERMAADLGLERVEFCGFSTNPAEHLKTASILCLPSDLEGWGMVLIEAMHHGVVPIAFKCSDGVKEVLANGRGVLVSHKHRHAYARKLSKLMTDEALRRKICSRHAEFLAEVNIDRVADRWEEFFNSL